MTIDEELLFETLTLLSASLPTGTLPKLTALGETRSPPPTGSLTPDPHPDIPIVKQQAKTNTRIFPHLLNQRIFVSDPIRSRFRLENFPSNVPAGVDTTQLENGKIA
jgi:hypothetical protein